MHSSVSNKINKQNQIGGVISYSNVSSAVGDSVRSPCRFKHISTLHNKLSKWSRLRLLLLLLTRDRLHVILRLLILNLEINICRESLKIVHAFKYKKLYFMFLAVSCNLE